MIQKIGEEWARVNETLQRLDQAPIGSDLKDLVAGVNKVREAIRSLCDVNITRTNFKAAVREALLPLLKEHGEDQLLPSTTRHVTSEVAGQLASRLQGLEARFRSAQDASPLRSTPVAPEVLAKLQGFEDRLSRLASLQDDLGFSLGETDARVGLTESRLDGLDSGLDGVTAQLGNLETRLSEVQLSEGEVNFRVAELEGLQGQTSSELLEVQKAMTTELGRLEASMAEGFAEAARQGAARLETEAARREELRAQLQAEFHERHATIEDSILRIEAAVRSEIVAGLDHLRCEMPEVALQKATEISSRAEARLRSESDEASLAWKTLFKDLKTATSTLIEGKARDLTQSFRAEVEASSGRLVGLISALERSVPESIGQQARETEAGLRAESRLAIQSGIASLETQLVELLRGLEGTVSEVDRRQGQELTTLRSAVDSQLTKGLAAQEARTDRLRDEFSKLLSALEASVPRILAAGAEELEAKFGKEMDQMLDRLSTRIAELREHLINLENTVPRRETVGSIDDRLGRLEDRLACVASHVESIDALTPEFQTMAQKLSDLKGQLASIASGVEATSDGVTDVGRGVEGVGRSVHGVGQAVEGFRQGVSQSLKDLETILGAGIQRWESDQSHMLERVSAIRDTLREQLRAVAERIDAGGGLWNKLTGKGEGEVRLSKDDWSHVSNKLEGIISGLESILSKKHPRR